MQSGETAERGIKFGGSPIDHGAELAQKRNAEPPAPHTVRTVPRQDLPQEKDFSASCAWQLSWLCPSSSQPFSWAWLFSWPRPSSSARSFSPGFSSPPSPWEQPPVLLPRPAL